ncbi:MAG: hypothetical protein K2H32_04765 [Muribaculaceae bacterium]|nr:hypothetical protein [Muribaculaceae bacterium]MDE5857647.1 hypothetical protein [Muribaculaceae bacterium]
MLRVYSILILLLIAGGINAQSSNPPDSTDIAADSIDNRPLLKRWFKDFPVVYSDTAYTGTNYVFVFKATLMNHSWHHHSHENMKRQRVYAIPDSASDDNQSNSLVKFIPNQRD